MKNESLVEPTHSFIVEEAIRLGSIEKALILKEIRSMVIYKVRVNKRPWVFYSANALERKFPYMSSRSIQRWLQELEENNELVSKVKNSTKYDKTKSYSLPEFKDIDFDPNDPESSPYFEKYQELRSQNIQQSSITHFTSFADQNGSSCNQNGSPIPPLTTSHSFKYREAPASAQNLERKEEQADSEIPTSFEEFMNSRGWSLQSYPSNEEGIDEFTEWGKITDKNRMISNGVKNALLREFEKLRGGKAIPTISSLPRKFSYHEALEKLSKSKNLSDKIIALFFKVKGYEFDDAAQMQAQVRRNIKVARQLTGYSKSQLEKTMYLCEDDSRKNSYNWTLETVFKKIADVVNR